MYSVTDTPFHAVFPDSLFGETLSALDGRQHIALTGAGNLTAKTLLLAKYLKAKKAPALYLTQDAAEATQAAAALRQMQEREVLLLPEMGRDATRAEMVRLYRLADRLASFTGIVVATYRTACLLRLPEKRRAEALTLCLKEGDHFSYGDFFNDLLRIGYHKASSADDILPGEYHTHGSVLLLCPVLAERPVRIQYYGDEIESIEDDAGSIALTPLLGSLLTQSLLGSMPEGSVTVLDDILLDEENEDDRQLPPLSDFLTGCAGKSLTFTSFPEGETDFVSMRFLSVLKYVSPLDFTHDLRTKKDIGWHTLLVTKQEDEVRGILKEKNMVFLDTATVQKKPEVTVLTLESDATLPTAFQNPALKIALITDREIFGFSHAAPTSSEQKVYLDFITSLRSGDYIVHVDHGIGIFRGIETKTIDDITREYLRLDYAEGDKLFIPIDQAEKVSRFIGGSGEPPRLTRLGGSEWSTVQARVAAETEEIAKELLDLYAARAAVKGYAFPPDGPRQAAFEAGFPYEETPGQLKAILDTKADMERSQPMDRLVCGDVGFGKTEVAMRAAFKAAMAGKQVAFISPITILADQHFRSLSKRLEGFEVSCELLSRFRTQREQTQVLKGLADGSVQIVVGTHRLLQQDIVFKDLGLVIIDEEQRFGVEQKEVLKNLRKSVDILTLTATPIPRTLNMSLNKLRDITTITTPPPGRLPIITEVRHFSWKLIADAIRTEMARGGQVYFLHNRVATIEGVAERLRDLLPEARCVVTHGQLKPTDLEERIMDFTHGKYDVLISSTIIENGIDLPNANTLIVNSAENFGLSQLYQLRGRVGRGKAQAYAYFLYQDKMLKTDAKKRLRAIVEASELGSGFEIAMKDLEIRGAGEILGSSQSGAITSVGVSHFVRMLAQAVEDHKSGKVSEASETKEASKADVTLELPISALIPVHYISDTQQKIRAYQKLSGADSEATLDSLKAELTATYGKMPLEVIQLFRVLEVKLAARKAGVVAVKMASVSQHRREATLVLSKKVKPPHIMNALSKNPKWQIVGSSLKIDAAHLGIDFLRGLLDTLTALQSEYRGDAVAAKE